MKGRTMKLGLQTILLIAAVVVFVVAAIDKGNQFDLLAIGLALLAGAQLVGHLGLGKLARRRLRV
jgi:hypothetical protein